MSVRPIYSDEQTLQQALRLGEEPAFEQVMRSCYRQISHLVRTNNGNESDAQDVFQEALIVLVRKLRDKDFTLEAAVCTYLYSVARFTWYRRLDKNRRLSFTLDDDESTMQLTAEDQIEEKKETEKKHLLASKIFSELSEDCRKIIAEFYHKKRALEDLAAEMDLTYSYIRVKKYRCMNEYKVKLQEDPEYEQLQG